MNYEYSDKVTFKSSKLRLVTDKEGRLFVRKNVRIDADLAEKLSSISCPYIVNFMGFGEDEDGAYVIEEYVDGVTAAERAFTQKQAVKVLIELCEALETLHSAKIIHRDIKPSNLIIAPDGHIKLIDFDASRIEKAVKDRDTQILGTEGFAPPEQFGFSQTDCRSDIYSFGVTMSILLGENAAPFVGIIRKCKALDPNDRYDSISKVKAAIKLAMVKRFAAIPVAVALLAGFTIVFSMALKHRDTIDYTNAPSSESYVSSAPVSGALQLPSSAVRLENGSKALGSSATSASDGFPVSKPPESSQPPATSKPPESSQSPVISEPPESSQPPATSKPPESSSNTEGSQSTSVDHPAETNGFYHTVKNEYGYYNDVCSYVFNDDPSVHGSWEVIGTLKKDDLHSFLKGNTDLMYGGADTQDIEDSERAWIQRVTLSPDGTATISVTFKAKWTKGYIVLDYSDRHYVEELFQVEVGGTEYLMIEKKTGEYVKTGVSDAYFVYKREEEFEDPPEENEAQTGKITYRTYLGDDGYYHDECDYRFYDDPSVHGKWKIFGTIKADKYDSWIAGTAKPGDNYAWLDKIEIFPEGDAVVSNSMKCLWTNGYLVRINAHKVSALFTVTVDGTEYLVIENKNGDYRRLGYVKTLFIYTRDDS